MKTSSNIYDLVKNASTFACITPGTYYLDKPLEITAPASLGVFRLFCIGCTFYLSAPFCSSAVSLYIEGGTFYPGSFDLFSTSDANSALSATFQGTILQGANPFANNALRGTAWANGALIG